MSNSLLMLRLEHRNTAQLLRCLERQAVMMASEIPPDRNLLSLTMSYFQGFPDLCHHPKENLIFDVLAQRDPDATSAMGDLRSDHDQLKNLTDEVSAVVNSEEMPDSRIIAALESFIDNYRKHMEGEEEYFFPAAESALTADDWASIDFAVFDHDDPLFHHSNEQHFADLRDLISEVDGQRRKEYQAWERSRHMNGTNSIKDFNELMIDQEISYRLVGFVDGGWALEHDGELVSHIPPCSEVRAAWCALMFKMGIDVGLPDGDPDQRPMKFDGKTT